MNDVTDANQQTKNEPAYCNNPPKKKRGRSTSLALDDKINNNVVLEAIGSLKSHLTSKIDSLSAQFDQKIADVKAEIGEVKTELVNQVAALSSSMETKLGEKASIEEIKRVDNEINLMKKSIYSTETRIDKLEREALLRQLIISGVPYDHKESIVLIMSDICTTIGFKDGPSCFVAYRLRKPNFNQATASSSSSTSTSSSSASSAFTVSQTQYTNIFMKFNSVNQRFQFWHCYLACKTLNLTNIGYSTAKRIFINEILTPKNAEICFRARKLKAANKIKRYYSARGIVHILMGDNVNPVPIHCLNDLPQIET